MLDLSWPTTKGDLGAQRHLNAAAFVSLVRRNPGFWGCDFPLKYLSIHIDTREGGYFSLSDRDGNRIHPNRVLLAIHHWKQRHKG